MNNPGRKEFRSPDRLRAHYLVERELADRLRAATAAERPRLYSAVYDELYRRVPDHPQLTRKADADSQLEAVGLKLRLLSPFLRDNLDFMEIGPGDCSLAIAVAGRVRRVIAVDVSAEITKNIDLPSNFELRISEGAELPVEAESVDLAFSYQLVEHLHPADALEHFRNVQRCLRPRGVYVCVTPSRLNGPHDISGYFDADACGFHMKEYTTTELAGLMKDCGFGRVQLLLSVKAFLTKVPTAPVWILERLLEALPHRQRRGLANLPLIRQLVGITVVASK